MRGRRGRSREGLAGASCRARGVPEKGKGLGSVVGRAEEKDHLLARGDGHADRPRRFRSRPFPCRSPPWERKGPCPGRAAPLGCPLARERRRRCCQGGQAARDGLMSLPPIQGQAGDSMEWWMSVSARPKGAASGLPAPAERLSAAMRACSEPASTQARTRAAGASARAGARSREGSKCRALPSLTERHACTEASGRAREPRNAQRRVQPRTVAQEADAGGFQPFHGRLP
jgi:hypothetical protein